MTFSGHTPHLFKWQNLWPTETLAEKLDDLDLWRKRVEKASDFAVSEVFPKKKRRSGFNKLAVPLRSTEQLRDHDDAYSEARALLGDWFNNKLRTELGVEDEDDLTCSDKTPNQTAQTFMQPSVHTYNNFDDLYNSLDKEDEEDAVDNFLQNLMEHEILDSTMMAELEVDDGKTNRRCRDPSVTMEARHQQVRENRARQEAKRLRQQREKEAQQEAMKEARRIEREKEMRKRLEQLRQEELMQQEVARLRREREERKALEQVIRQKEKAAKQKETSHQIVPALPARQLQEDAERLKKEKKIQVKVYMNNLKCLQRHFSGWYSVTMDHKLNIGKAVALCTWRKQLKAWRAWRTVVWAEKQQREMARTEEALRKENRQLRLAAESDRRRLLRRYLNEWYVSAKAKQQQRELHAQQQTIKSKMATLLEAASAGKLAVMESPAYQPVAAVTEPPNQSVNAPQDHHMSGPVGADSSTVHQDKTLVRTASQPSQAWQVTRRHTAPTAAQLQEACQKMERAVFTNPKRKVALGGRFENRHTVQQQIITQQRKLLKEQQEQITLLKEKQNIIDLELEMEKTAQLTRLSVLRGFRPKCQSSNCREQREPQPIKEQQSQALPPKKIVPNPLTPHPLITAMEARAQERAKRRKEIEELRRKKEEEKLAELKAAEEQRQREEEEEKRKAAEKRREEKRLEREREEEKQRQLKRQQELMRLACQHYHKTLLLRRGLAPWKRMIQFRHANMELADKCHHLTLLRCFLLRWQQAARELMSKKEALADQLYQHFLLRRSFSSWNRLKDLWMIQEERAKRFYRRRTLRRFLLALLDHVTQERLLEWDRQAVANEHNNRRVLQQCFLAWRKLPYVLRKERERNQRREKLIRKVVEVLPDFRPQLD